jgi:acyl dehydratase
MGIRHILQFEHPPATWRMFLQTLAAGKPAWVGEGNHVPRIEAVLASAVADPRRLARYSAVTGAPATEWLPIAYPHVLAAPLHLAVFSARAFPVRSLGLVHVRNVIVQRRPLRLDESFQLRCSIEGHRELERGQEFDLHTALIAGGAQVWHEIATLLARSRALAGGNRVRRAAVPESTVSAYTPVKAVTLHASGNIGRRYAAVSGDFNPIHLSVLTARMFQFRRAIAHGMWSLARCASEVGADNQSGEKVLDVTFRRPIFLPATLTLQRSASDGDCEFSLRDVCNEKPVLTGTLRVSR